MASRGVNKVILLGNLGQDPGVRYMPNGQAVVNLSLATSETWKDQAGQQQERTEWHRLVLYRRLAEIAGEYLRKGSKVYIEGRLRTSQYEKNGEKRFSTEIVVDELQMLDRPDSAPRQGSQNAPPTSGPTPGYDAGFDDDIPFAPIGARAGVMV